MSKVYCDITVSVDGYVAGPNQSEEKPFGERLFDGVPGQPLELVAARPASRVTYVTYRITP